MLSEAQVSQYLHNIFDGEAKCFYRDKVAPAFNNYGPGKVFFIRNYNSISRQICIRQLLQGVS